MKHSSAVWFVRVGLGLLTHLLDVRDGKLHLSDRPGLGVDLVEAELERHPGVRELGCRKNFYV